MFWLLMPLCCCCGAAAAAGGSATAPPAAGFGAWARAGPAASAASAARSTRAFRRALFMQPSFRSVVSDVVVLAVLRPRLELLLPGVLVADLPTRRGECRARVLLRAAAAPGRGIELDALGVGLWLLAAGRQQHHGRT